MFICCCMHVKLNCKAIYSLLTSDKKFEIQGNISNKSNRESRQGNWRTPGGEGEQSHGSPGIAGCLWRAEGWHGDREKSFRGSQERGNVLLARMNANVTKKIALKFKKLSLFYISFYRNILLIKEKMFLLMI